MSAESVLIGPLQIQSVITGLSLGSRLFLIAVGLSLIFGVLGVLNFAHGMLFALGAYLTITLAESFVDSFWVGLVAGALVAGVVGAVIEMGFIRRLYQRAESELEQLILTFAFVLILIDSIKFIWGGGTQATSIPPSLDSTLRIAGIDLLAYRLFIIVLAVLVMILLWVGIQRTYFGQLIRATSSDRTMASLIGVNVPRMYTAVFFIGSVLAGVGGALAAPLQAITPAVGDAIIIDAFVVVVIGGLGSFTGAFVGAMLIGLLRSFGVLFFKGAGLFLPFVAMILVLIVRPQGLFGEVES